MVHKIIIEIYYNLFNYIYNYFFNKRVIIKTYLYKDSEYIYLIDLDYEDIKEIKSQIYLNINTNNSLKKSLYNKKVLYSDVIVSEYGNKNGCTLFRHKFNYIDGILYDDIYDYDILRRKIKMKKILE